MRVIPKIGGGMRQGFCAIKQAAKTWEKALAAWVLALHQVRVSY